MNLTQGNIKKTLFKFAIPIIVIQVLNQLYSLTDSVIVSRFAGGNEFAILSNISTLTMLGYCLVQGGAIATNVIFANLFGSNSQKELASAKKTFNIIILIYGTLIALFYSVFAKQLLQLINIPTVLLSKAISVLIIYALNFIPVGIIVVNQGILNGYGDSKTPMRLSIIFQFLNLVLDYIVVAIFPYGVIGAALASLLASSLSAIAMYYKSSNLLKDYKQYAKFSKDWLTKAVKLAIPSTISQSVASLGSFILQIIVNNYGIEIINGYSVGCTLNNFILCPILGLCSAYESFGGQNLGANQNDRVKQGFKLTLTYGLLSCLIASILSLSLNNLFISLYISDKTLESFKFASKFFNVMCLNYFALFIKNSFDSYYKAHQKMTLLAIISAITLVIRVILSFTLTTSIGPIFLAWACVISNVIGILIYLTIIKNNNKLESIE